MADTHWGEPVLAGLSTTTTEPSGLAQTPSRGLQQGTNSPPEKRRKAGGGPTLSQGSLGPVLSRRRQYSRRPGGGLLGQQTADVTVSTGLLPGTRDPPSPRAVSRAGAVSRDGCDIWPPSAANQNHSPTCPPANTDRSDVLGGHGGVGMGGGGCVGGGRVAGAPPTYATPRIGPRRRDRCHCDGMKGGPHGRRPTSPPHHTRRACQRTGLGRGREGAEN